jgi:hypothetical protein
MPLKTFLHIFTWPSTMLKNSDPPPYFSQPTPLLLYDQSLTMAPPLSAGLTIKSLSVLRSWAACRSSLDIFGFACSLCFSYTVLRSW